MHSCPQWPPVWSWPNWVDPCPLRQYQPGLVLRVSFRQSGRNISNVPLEASLQPVHLQYHCRSWFPPGGLWSLPWQGTLVPFQTMRAGSCLHKVWGIAFLHPLVTTSLKVVSNFGMTVWRLIPEYPRNVSQSMVLWKPVCSVDHHTWKPSAHPIWNAVQPLGSWDSP